MQNIKANKGKAGHRWSSQIPDISQDLADSVRHFLDSIRLYLSKLGRIEPSASHKEYDAYKRIIAEQVRLDLLDAMGEKLWYSQTNIPRF